MLCLLPCLSVAVLHWPCSPPSAPCAVCVLVVAANGGQPACEAGGSSEPVKGVLPSFFYLTALFCPASPANNLSMPSIPLVKVSPWQLSMIYLALIRLPLHLHFLPLSLISVPAGLLDW